ncbi:MAG TPA: VWA domain-containing protein [Vicinamibacterales bacterium]
MTKYLSVVAATALLIQPPAFHTRVEVVTVDVSVTRADATVAGLTADDFIVTDSGVRQRIDTVTVSRAPLSVTLVLDTSGSVAGQRLDALISASDQVVNELRTNDYVSLIRFSSTVAHPVELTTNFESVRSALHALTGAADTSLRDALFLALQTRPHEATRPLVLIFTDGADTSSWLSPDEVLESVRHANVVIHAVAFGSHAFLKDVTREAGGRIWFASSNRDLQKLFGRAIRDIREHYVLTYTPSGVGQSGWHALSVKLSRTHGDVVARPGYWVNVH